MQASEYTLGMSIEDAARADHIINNLDGMVDRAKQKRLTTANAYKMPRHEFQPDPTAPQDAPLDPSWIKGASRSIFDACIRRGFTTTIECIGWSAEPHIVIAW